MPRRCLIYLLGCWLLLSMGGWLQPAVAQQKWLLGKVIDNQHGEPVPFASLRWQGDGVGAMADSAGSFRLSVSVLPSDTLEVTSVGYQDLRLPVQTTQYSADTFFLILRLVPGKLGMEVVVRSKVNRALILWKRVVARKPFNDRYRFDNFSYELYNKLELDLLNVRSEHLEKAPLLKKFDFLSDYITTIDSATVLPAYLTESVSQYYYSKDPARRREVFKGVKTIGVQNESIAKLLGGMDQNINVYNNFIPVFDKQFISPLSDRGDDYYRFRIADTQTVGGRRMIHLLFAPRRKGEQTFQGDCWIHDTTYAVQRITLRLGPEAGLNYITDLSLIQEYRMISDTGWFLSRDKIVADLSLGSKGQLGFTGRKTTTYREVVVNDTSVTAALALNRRAEEVILPEGVSQQEDTYWQGARHEALNAAEQGIYQMIDTLLRSPAFVRTTRKLDFLGTGYRQVGNYTIGPWQNWISSNTEEGLRLRFDLSTNRHFNDRMTFHGYLAYGFGDRRWKGAIDGLFLLGRSPRSYLYAAYRNDFDYGQQYYDEISADNIFALAIRKPGVPIKLMRLEEAGLDYFKEWLSGFSVLLSGRQRQFDPVRNLPEIALPPGLNGDVPQAFETSVRLRYAYLEKFIENTFYRYSLGSPLPIVELKYARGWPGSGYGYHKLSGSISNYRDIPPLGNMYVNLFGGRTFGTLPYMFLDVAPGNELHYYNRYAFNLMNRFEYLHDRYAGLNLEHNFGSGIFRFIPLTRKLKFRQLWTSKLLWGRLSDENRQLNSSTAYFFNQLNGRTYWEVGTGVDNIFRLLRLDFIWKVLPQESSKANSKRFGVFGSLRFAF